MNTCTCVEETFIPAESLMNTTDLEGWDNLVSRGTKAKGRSRWERESLYVKFDPMFTIPSPNRRTSTTTTTDKSLPAEQHLLPLVAFDEEDFVVLPYVEKTGHCHCGLDTVIVTDDPKENQQQQQENFRQVLLTRHDLLLQLNESQRKLTIAMEECNQTLEDLRNVDSAFSDVHRKYERAKAVLDNLKKNEEMLKEQNKHLMDEIEMRDKKTEHLKFEFQKSLESKYHDYERKIQQAESEAHINRALIRKHEMKIHSYENDLQQKISENAELNALCDDLIKGKP